MSLTTKLRRFTHRLYTLPSSRFEKGFQGGTVEGSVTRGSTGFAKRESTMEEIYIRKKDAEHLENLRQELKEKEQEYVEKWGKNDGS
jgi:hypothetical protein